MFAVKIRSIFGDIIDCRINGKPKRVTWRDEHTLVIEPDPYATAPVDTDKFGASWRGLEALASQLRGDCSQEGFARST
jgi:anaerobic glycerol-3-phosphate dehydrogenase